MKIRKIKWKSHPILGDLLLDFINPETKEIYDIIIFAGENGSGKTTILSSLNDFLNRQPMDHMEFIEYKIGENVYKAVPPTNTDDLNRGFYDVILPDKKRIHMLSGRNLQNNAVDDDERNIRDYGTVYSDAKTNFNEGKITSVTTGEIDTLKHYDKNVTGTRQTSVKQLIVDIEAKDDSEYKSINKMKGEKGEAPMPYLEFEKMSRMYRFKTAFNNFFEGKVKFDKIKDENGEKVVVFSKNGKTFSIDNLSTGEKQVVFRGVELLRNLKKQSGGIVLIDEPELSMHPRWQRKLLNYYKEIFTDKNSKERLAQILIATHSSELLADALRNENLSIVKVFVIGVDDSGTIEPEEMETPLVLDGITSAEVNYQAFKIASTDYHNALYGYIEAEGRKDEFERLYPKTPYTKLLKKGSTTTLNVSLSEKLRHMIHHPENPHNGNIEEMGADIKESIERMRNFIIGKKSL